MLGEVLSALSMLESRFSVVQKDRLDDKEGRSPLTACSKLKRQMMERVGDFKSMQ